MSKQIGINRRRFLKGTGALTAGAIGFPYVVSSSALGKAGAIAPSNRLVVGCIGTGAKGTGDLRDFLAQDEVQVVAVCDVDKAHRDGAKRIVDDKYKNTDCTAYLDFRELIARGDLDVAVLALPDHWHSIPAIMAARAGLDIHAQKPFARTIAEGRAMCNAVRQNGVIWQTGSQQRSGVQFHRACELVRNGRIGKVHRIEVGLPDGNSGGVDKPQPVPEGLDWDFWLGPAPWRPFTSFSKSDSGKHRACHWDWRWIMDYSGGQLTDWAGHHVDIAHWGMGLDRTGPVEMQGKGVFPQEGLYNTPTEYRIEYKYANGLEMTVANQSQLPHGRGVCWYGDKGWIFVTRGALRAEPASILKEIIEPGETRLYKSSNHVRNFLDCVKSRAETITPAEVGHRSISVGLLGEIAMLTGRKLKWDPDKEVFTNDADANRYLTRAMRSPWHL